MTATRIAPPDSKPLEHAALAALDAARRAGAAQAEACVEGTRAFTVRANGGAVDTLKHSATRGVGLRVFVDGRVGFVSSNDLSRESLDDLARHAVALARFSTPDEANGLPRADECAGDDPGDLGAFDPALLELTPERKIAMALELERTALAADPRITRTEGALVSSSDGAAAIANSDGLLRAWTGGAVRVYVLPLAGDRDGKQQTGYYGMVQRRLDQLEPLESIAREAVRRAVSRIGARSVATAKVPVILHPDVAAAWIAEMHGAFSGEAHLKQTTWLTGKLDETIASPLVTMIDDGRMPDRVGSEPFDGEGVPTRRNVLIERGRMAMLEYDVYHARRAGTRSTGNAVRGYSSTPSIGAHNLYVERGDRTPEHILASVDRGFYYDDQGSFGWNDVTGDYSYQAQGFWVEKGEKAFPVDGVTVASNALDMLRNVVAVGDDLRFEGSVSCPTLLIGEMTVSGSGR